MTCSSPAASQDRLQHRHQLHGRAVRVGDDARGARARPPGSRRPPPAARRAACGTPTSCRRPPRRARPRSAPTRASACAPAREERDVDAVERLGRDGAAPRRSSSPNADALAGAARRGQADAARRAGSSRSASTRSRTSPTAPVAPRMATLGTDGLLLRRLAVELEGVVQRRARRVGISRFAIMHEILIGDVEIIRRLIPWSASVRNIFAATPGCERMPAPISETFRGRGPRRRPSSPSTASAPSMPRRAAARPRAAPRTTARRRRGRRSG